MAGSRLNAVHAQRLGQARRIRVLFHRFRAKLDRKLTEHAVAGVRERGFDVLFAVRIRAGHDITADFDRAGAVPLSLEQVGNVLDCGVQRHDLEDRAGNGVRGQQAVDVNAVPRRVVVRNIGRIGRVERRRRDHAEDLAGLVVVNADRAALTAERLIGHAVQLGVDGQIDAVARAERRVRARQQVVAGQLVRERGQRTRADVAGRVAHSVQRRAADRTVLVIDTLAVLGERREHDAPAVDDGAALEYAGVVVQMAVVGVGRPVVAVRDKAEAEKRKSDAEQRRQNEAEHAAFFDFTHLFSPPLSARGGSAAARRTKRSGVCRSP